MAYTLILTEEDFDIIDFVGNRYCWSDALSLECCEGENEIGEADAWLLKDSFEIDTEGDHGFFPMLDHRSELAVKLFAFMESIV